MCLTGKPKSKFKTQKAHQLNLIILEFRGSWGGELVLNKAKIQQFIPKTKLV
jgi:hypothetical protein